MPPSVRSSFFYGRRESSSDSVHLAQSPGEPVWLAIHDLIKNVSEIMMSSIPSFWKISKSFMDGKFKKVGKVYPSLLSLNQSS